MNDQELKNLFKSMKYGESSEIEVARWKKVVLQQLNDRRPKEWMRLAAACLIGVVIGATAFNGQKNERNTETIADDATIEQIHVNL